jgi:hypothetical protein
MQFSILKWDIVQNYFGAQMAQPVVLFVEAPALLLSCGMRHAQAVS